MNQEPGDLTPKINSEAGSGDDSFSGVTAGLEPCAVIRAHVRKMDRALVEVEAQIVRQPNISSAVKEGTPALRDILETIWDQCTSLEKLERERLLANEVAMAERATGASNKRPRESTGSSQEQHSAYQRVKHRDAGEWKQPVKRKGKKRRKEEVAHSQGSTPVPASATEVVGNQRPP